MSQYDIANIDRTVESSGQENEKSHRNQVETKKVYQREYSKTYYRKSLEKERTPM